MKFNQPILVLLTILTISIVLAGCSSEDDEDETLNNVVTDKVKEKNIRIYYYYSPNCFSCQQVKPYMNLLVSEVKEVEFDLCNVRDIENCSARSLMVMKMVELQYIPTAVVKTDDGIYVLVGSEEVLRLGELLEKYGIDTPNAVYKNVSYDIESCIACHEERGLPPPSTYSCTSCCHMG